MNTMKQLIAFVAGAALGSLATWIFVKDKYEQRAQEDIDSVKERYSKKKQNTDKKLDDEQDNQVDEKGVEEYENVIESSGYSKYSDISNKKVLRKAVAYKELDRPYIIKPEEFGNLDDYELISLTHYSDGVLADDGDEKMTDEEIDEVVGADYAKHFGEYEDDSVFVRNDKLKCDYEILLDNRKYSELPHVMRRKGAPD